MLVMLDSNKLDQAEEELGRPCEQLLTPLTRFRRVRIAQPYCIDNGCYSNPALVGFQSLLSREEHAKCFCRWVSVPDKVADAHQTNKLFSHWEPKLKGWPLAYVAQDHLVLSDVPWDSIVCVFIGGSTWFKMNRAEEIISSAKDKGKWVHMGRVNTVTRFLYCERIGCNSIDGSGIARYTSMRQNIRDYQPPKNTLFKVK
jgi:hypothetical protein